MKNVVICPGYRRLSVYALNIPAGTGIWFRAGIVGNDTLVWAKETDADALIDAIKALKGVSNCWLMRVNQIVVAFSDPSHGRVAVDDPATQAVMRTLREQIDPHLGLWEGVAFELDHWKVGRSLAVQPA